MSNPQLLEQAGQGQAGFFLQFGGQGAPWLKELAGHYHSGGELRRMIEVGLTAIEEEKGRVDGTVGLPHGIDPRKWLTDEASVPSEEYLGSAAVSIPMIQLTQFAHFEALRQAGYAQDLIRHTRGLAGHSQGLIPSSLVSMGLQGESYLAQVAKYMKYLLYLGVRGQEAHPFFEATTEETARNAVLGLKGSPTPMVAFLGTDLATTEKMVAEVNAKLPAEKQVYISLQNSPSNRILSSFRSSLLAFHEMHRTRMDENKWKFVYIRTTCPFHCVLLEGIRGPFEQEIARLGFSYPGSALKAPVYSFSDGRNMQSDKELALKMYEDLAINTLYWEKAVKPVAGDGKITHVIDFGPGKASQRLTSDTLEAAGCATPVLAVAVPKDLKALTA